jgi:LacI family transcriptional regulator
MDAVVKQGLSSQEGWLVEGDYKIEGGYAAMSRILAQKDLPTAIVTANDLTAIGALKKAHETNLRIPEDISISGCDNIAMSDIVHPPLTTLQISRKEYARLLFEALRAGTENLGRPGLQYVLPTSLIIRKSTGPAPERQRPRKAG